MPPGSLGPVHPSRSRCTPDGDVAPRQQRRAPLAITERAVIVDALAVDLVRNLGRSLWWRRIGGRLLRLRQNNWRTVEDSDYRSGCLPIGPGLPGLVVDVEVPLYSAPFFVHRTSDFAATFLGAEYSEYSALHWSLFFGRHLIEVAFFSPVILPLGVAQGVNIGQHLRDGRGGC